MKIKILYIDVIDKKYIKKSTEPEENIIDYVVSEKTNILEFLNKYKYMKYEIVVRVLLTNTKDNAFQTIKIRTGQVIKINNQMNIEESISTLPEKLDADLLNIVGSGWVIAKFVGIEIIISKINILLGVTFYEFAIYFK